jgi:alkanesulfonate monooxygenase SsuD/methylene tetrahydromethanopterin reductase-like flavin-dependent oxidoreductase (luciferase family)
VATPAEAAAELSTYGPIPPDRQEFPRIFVGTPDKVRKELLTMASSLNIHELVVNTITHDPAARLRSYRLLAEAMALAVAA